MSSYDFQHPVTNQIITLYQSMDSDHKFIDSEGVEWVRLFSVPNTVIDRISNINPRDSQQFIEATRKKKGTLGNLYQLSAELSEKRKSQEGGIDRIQAQSWENYEKSRVKAVHPDKKKQQMQEFAKKNKYFDIDL